MLFSFNEQWSIACWGKLNSAKGTYLQWWKRLILKTTHFQGRTKACAWRSLSLAKMISDGLDSMQNKLIVSRRVCIQNSNNASRTMQDGRSTPRSCLLTANSGWLPGGLATPVFRLIVTERGLLLLFFWSFLPIFTSSCFPLLSQFHYRASSHV